MKKINIISTPANINFSDNFTPFTITGVKVAGPVGEGLLHALSMLDKTLSICEDGNLVIYNGFEHFPQSLKEKTAELFEKKFAKQQGYYLAKNGETVVIAAYEEDGSMYVIMTLMQMF